MCSRALLEWGICIDNFQKPKNERDDIVFFLTHLHGDHTAGLSATWSHGPLHVSEQTQLLLEDRFQSSTMLTHIVPWKTKTWKMLKIRGKQVEVACYPAWHCSGSVMWLFKFPTGATAVHTGDYRLDDLTWSGWERIRPVSILLYD